MIENELKLQKNVERKKNDMMMVIQIKLIYNDYSCL